MKKLTLAFIAFLQASGLFAYIMLVDVFLTRMSMKFTFSPNPFIAPIIMLLVFIASAVISASLVLGKASVLFWEKEYKKSFSLLGMTVFWIIFYLGLTLLVVFIR